MLLVVFKHYYLTFGFMQNKPGDIVSLTFLAGSRALEEAEKRFFINKNGRDYLVLSEVDKFASDATVLVDPLTCKTIADRLGTIVLDYVVKHPQELDQFSKFYKDRHKVVNIPDRKLPPKLVNWLSAYYPDHFFKVEIPLVIAEGHPALDNIRHLDFTETKITDEDLRQIVLSCPNLRSVRLTRCENITSEAIKILSSLKHISFLDLEDCDVTNDWLEHLKDMPYLEYLNLSNCFGITDRWMPALKAMKHLEVLHLTNCSKISDIGIANLRGAQRLVVLDVGGCNLLTDKTLHLVATLRAIVKLNISGCTAFSSEAIQNLKVLEILMFLDISGCTHVTDETMEGLRGLKRLRSLKMLNCEYVTDKSFQFPKVDPVRKSSLEQPFQHLTELDISGCHRVGDGALIGSDNVNTISSLGGLITLSLEDCAHVTDRGVQSLERLRQLQRINLSGCEDITDESLRVLAGLRYLTSINVSSCPLVTDAGVGALVSLRGLAQLTVRGCPKVTNHGTDELRKHNQHLSVIRTFRKL